MSTETFESAALIEPPRAISRYNMATGVIDGIGWPLGMAIFSTTTLLPEFLLHLHASYLQIGLMPAIVSLGYFLPGILVASFISRLEYVRTYLVAVGLVERIPLFIAPALIYLVGNHRPGLLLILFYGALLAHSLATGFNQPSYWSLIGKLIPANWRGRMYGAAGLVGGLLGLGVGPVTHFLLARAPAGSLTGYANCFFLAATIILLSFLPFIWLREHPSERSSKSDMHAGHYGRDLVRVWRADAGFRRLIWAQTAVAAWSCVAPFFVPAAHGRWQVDSREVALYATVNVVALAFGNLIWGHWADRKGNRRVLITSSAVLIIGTVLSLAPISAAAYAFVFVLTALGNGGLNIAGYNMALEFAPSEADMPFFMATLNFVTGLVRMAAPLVGGLIATSFGFGPLFALGSAFAVGALVATLCLPEPRRRRSSETG
ncbi:MAG: MFS transporter [Capsulimonadaceae bacterium]|nr:MFS transporter [Capsulimonadaceae bacterium]